MRILLVKDDSTEAGRVETHLTANRHEVEIANQIPEALDLFEIGEFEAVILMLSDTRGQVFLDSVRQSSHVPVFIISKVNDLKIKRNMFSRGVDDYLVAPYDREELLFRLIRAVNRCSQLESPVKKLNVDTESPNILKLGEITIDTNLRVLSSASKSVRLERFVFKLFEAYGEKPNIYISHYVAIRMIWGERSPGRNVNNLRQLIFQGRQKLKEVDVSPMLLDSQPGYGFRLIVRTAADGAHSLKQAIDCPTIAPALKGSNPS